MKFLEGIKKFFTVIVSTVKAPGPEFELSTKRLTSIALVVTAIIYVFTHQTIDYLVLLCLIGPAAGIQIAGAATKS